MTQKYLIYILLLPFVFFVFWIGYLSTGVKSGQEIILPITGYDPRNLLSGHYIDYQINWAHADCTQFDGDICPKDGFNQNGRVYVPEKYAARLEKMLNDSAYQFEVVYAYKPGRAPIVKELLINGHNWREVVR